MERTKIVGNSSFMNSNSSPKEGYLEEGKKEEKKNINWVWQVLWLYFDYLVNELQSFYCDW